MTLRIDEQCLTAEDYDEMGAQGLSEEELLEVIGLAALGNHIDTVADTMKVEVDSVLADAPTG